MLAQQHGAEQGLDQAQADDDHPDGEVPAGPHEVAESDGHTDEEKDQARHAKEGEKQEAPFPECVIVLHVRAPTWLSAKSSTLLGALARTWAPAAASAARARSRH